MHSCVRLLLGSLCVAVSMLPQTLNSSRKAVTSCQVSPTVTDEPAKDPNADSFGFQDWFVNTERTIWTSHQHWKAGPDGNKVIWIRPAGLELTVTGTRIDNSKVWILAKDHPAWYPTGFTVVNLIVPFPGCWEVIAKAGTRELRFVTAVEP